MVLSCGKRALGRISASVRGGGWKGARKRDRRGGAEGVYRRAGAVETSAHESTVSVGSSDVATDAAGHARSGGVTIRREGARRRSGLAGRVREEDSRVRLNEDSARHGYQLLSGSSFARTES